jgi:signal transduction histidine kinase
MAVFKVAARTILHLGSELISSDEIALYELIKNAYDAKSKEVNIDVNIGFPHQRYKHLRILLLEQKNNKGQNVSNRVVNEFREKIISQINADAPFAERLKQDFSDADSLDKLIETLDAANYIRIKDMGHGMTLDDLNDVYLTIGTRYRYQERERQGKLFDREDTIKKSIRPVLGEKGVGRLSAMRLGQRLEVKTKKAGQKNWNYLYIDWSQFSHESDEFLEAVDAVKLQKGNEVTDPSVSGTVLTVTALSSEWTAKKLEDIARDEFSKLTDPFIPQSRYPIKLRFNNEEVRIPRFDKLVFELAHAYTEAEFSIDGGRPRLEGKVNYLLHKKSKKFLYTQDDLLALCNLETPATLKSLGPFKMMFYWVNRRLIRGIDGIGNQQQLRDLVARWTGGLMVFRDGFRINPYGGENDDWLDLDKRAFGSGGFKLNRRQVIGKVDISTYANPALIDQTNREGIQNNEEFDKLRILLKVILFNEFKLFTDFIDKEIKTIDRVSLKLLEERLEVEEEAVTENLNFLVKEFRIPRNSAAIKSLEESVEKIKDLLVKAKDLAEMHEDDKSKYLHLAALGLLAEIVVHELNRSSANVIASLKEIEKEELSSAVESQLNTLLAEMKTLQKRLRIFDPLSTRGRQVKESFDIVSWIDENMSAHKSQFGRHNIKLNFTVRPVEDGKLYIKAVKGMIVQILENLVDNSVYWIKEYKKTHTHYKPKITVEIDTTSSKLYFSDNGPGIPPERAEEVFLPFFSTKPFKLGKGLGLYISREIAEYNKAKLYLSGKKNDLGNLNTFVLELSNEKSN